MGDVCILVVSWMIDLSSLIYKDFEPNVCGNQIDLQGD